MLLARFIFIFNIFFRTLPAKDQCVENIINSESTLKNNSSISNTIAKQANFFFDTSQNMVGFINPGSLHINYLFLN